MSYLQTQSHSEVLGVKTSTYEFGGRHSSACNIQGNSRPPTWAAHQWGPLVFLPHNAQKAPKCPDTFLLNVREQSITRPWGKLTTGGQMPKPTNRWHTLGTWSVWTPCRAQGNSPIIPESRGKDATLTKQEQGIQKRITGEWENVSELNIEKFLNFKNWETVSPRKLDKKTKRQEIWEK